MPSADTIINARLSQAISAGSLPHALLIIGDSVCCGELVTFAASLLLKTDVTRVRYSPDYYTYNGEKLRVSDTTSGARKDTVTVSEILDSITTIPVGDCRVIHIENAGHMSEEVQNKLLKTLEEPPHGNYFFLHGFPEGLLPTVRSRCVTQNIGLLSADSAAKHAKMLAKQNGLELSEADAVYYCGLADSSVEQAYRLASDVEYLKLYMRCADYVCDIGTRLLIDKRLEDICKTQESARCLVTVFDLCVNDMLRDSISLAPRAFTRQPHADRLKKCALRIGTASLLKLTEALSQADAALSANLPTRAALFQLITTVERVVNKFGT